MSEPFIKWFSESEYVRSNLKKYSTSYPDPTKITFLHSCKNTAVSPINAARSSWISLHLVTRIAHIYFFTYVTYLWWPQQGARHRLSPHEPCVDTMNYVLLSHILATATLLIARHAVGAEVKRSRGITFVSMVELIFTLNTCSPSNK